MPRTKSILRYPGGKTQLSTFVNHVISLNAIADTIYCEPFCGGSGVAMELLLDNKVSGIILNDLDPAVYSIWSAVLHDTERLSENIQNIPITINEWYKQKMIYEKLKSIPGYNFDLGFAAFFLNRTNRAGIIMGGPIGGYEQNSKYPLSCRFNRSDIINKISAIATMRNSVRLYNLDAAVLIDNILLNENPNSLFTFFDPPYYKQGQVLYKNAFDDSKHRLLYQAIRRMDDNFWITTYDNAPEIREIYRDLPVHTYSLRYSANVVRNEFELLYKSPITTIESFDKVTLTQ